VELGFAPQLGGQQDTTMIDAYMDKAWEHIELAVHYMAALLDRLLLPLHPLGPALIIALLALVTVMITKLLGRVFNTRRHLELKKEFQHWYALRQQALTCEDPEKGKLLAKNIDHARLNRVYYDHFFEGLLKSLATRFLPLLVVLAYINNAFRPSHLLANFGRDHLFQWQWLVADPVNINAPFWFVMLVIGIYAIWALSDKLILEKLHKRPNVA
jgi:hypothetical protein